MSTSECSSTQIALNSAHRVQGPLLLLTVDRSLLRCDMLSCLGWLPRSSGPLPSASRWIRLGPHALASVMAGLRQDGPPVANGGPVMPPPAPVARTMSNISFPDGERLGTVCAQRTVIDLVLACCRTSSLYNFLPVA